jgi:hypothetical protein
MATIRLYAACGIIRRTATPGQGDAKTFLDRYGERLVYTRYGADGQRKRFTTVEIIKK